jgi:ATP-dependent RNA helicase RhlE
MSFDSFDLHPQILAGVEALGYSTPTPIQRRAIPPVLEGQDVLGLAQTGTGKTAAFALPILQRLVKRPRGRIGALIIAPTRELSDQISATFETLGRQTRLRSLPIYGGVSMAPQVSKLRSGVEIIVACPGRLLDHIRQNTIRLSSLEVLVLDEADRMLDMGFLPDIREIIKHVPAVRQTLMFGATMPDDIRKLAKDVLRSPVTVQVDPPAPAATVAQALYPVDSHLKTALLLHLLQRTETAAVLIFTRTKHRAQRLGEQLERAGYSTTSLRGNLSQNQRQAAIRGFRNGSYRVLVATDIAARGIDVSRISHVINYDMPDTTDAYTHRIGRTGRAEKAGEAYSLVTRDDEALVRNIESVLGTRLERRRLNKFDYQKPAPPRRDNDLRGERRVSRGGRPDREGAFNNRTPAAGPKRGRPSQGVPQAADLQPSFGYRSHRSRLAQHTFR